MLTVCSARASMLTSPGAAYGLSLPAPRLPEMPILGLLQNSTGHGYRVPVPILLRGFDQ
jgi:hypothetical protein